MATPIYQVVKPRTGGNLLTDSVREATNAIARHGFTEDRGVLLSAAATALDGTTPVHRLWHPKTGDFVWIGNPGERIKAVDLFGYQDQGLQFHARLSDGPGCIAVQRLAKGAFHRFAPANEVDALVADGWRTEGASFFGAPGTPATDPTTPSATDAPTPTPTEVPTPSSTEAPPPTVEPSQTSSPAPSTPPTSPPTDPPTTTEPPTQGSSFSFVVMPDTQTWTTSTRDTRFRNATRWIVSQAEVRDIEWVQHTGDVVNWGWLDRSQYDVASGAMRELEQAGIPYAAAVGNHDTRVVGVGGSSYVFQNNKSDCRELLGAEQCKASLLVRQTGEFNEYFSAEQYGHVAGAFEPGKVDNIFQTFEAGDRQWMVLTLELWPREEVVDWAEQVVTAHPDHYVIVQTHSYLNWNGTIAQDASYGATSPQYLYDQLVSRHANIKMVFSGHVGQTAHRTDATVGGNVVHSFLMNDFGGNTGPVRLMTIDTSAGTFNSKLYNPVDSSWMTQYDISGSLVLD